ncbi:conserved hypothetical protein [Desulforapulum autotrophicum HRM2]|uniref:Uncharacterized protein n=1 Tax=Desulforapulum autotrophicum (strain ATCC 43914 / DSM 3382 / VKM B-1955 / HRM2) TaxID=177437 RepID=C0Q8T1_DESAH|nr:DUF1508 domain-containing protein [Desulforapulum autotrophicum]ACN14421.1 conserved hypothetical protein [Desulforapulum autotrophicum HRM2]
MTLNSNKTGPEYIPKVPERDKSEDYEFLRKTGIEHIEQLASRLWTDYNIHDPGITTLELLCYTITDLGMRTNYPMADILAQETLGEKTDTPHFFTAREILPCNPVTENDFRKLMIDVPGVRNSWLDILENPKPEFFINCKKSRLTFKKESGFLPVNLMGLYKVVLDLEEHPELGNLNRIYFNRKVTGQVENPDPIEIKITQMPTWDYFWNKTIDPATIKSMTFGPLLPESGSNNYNTQLIIQTNSGKIHLHPLEIVTDKAQTPENILVIGSEIARSDKDAVLSIYTRMIETSYAIVKEVYETLHRHRNLCEDFHCFESIDMEEVGICMDIEIAPDADQEEILAHIFHQAANYFSPPVVFKTLMELMETGTPDEIFQGPVLDHGFIDDQDLAASRFVKTIYASDIINIVMDISGVVAVKNFLMASFYNGQSLPPSQKWVLEIKEGRTVKFSQDFSKIVFYKGQVPSHADQEVVGEHLLALKALERHNRLGKDQYNLYPPGGSHMDIEHYFSLQNDFPLCYSIGPEGLPPSAAPERKAQAKQFKAFLLFFEQLLADYLSQLAHVKDLFSMDPEIKKTYFWQPLFDITGLPTPDLPNVATLLKAFVNTLDLANNKAIDLDDPQTYKAHWDSFVQARTEAYLAAIHTPDTLRENQQTYINRKNRFLNHLLAQFCESFSEYAVVMYTTHRKQASTDLEIISDKLSFLNDYPRIGKDRGKAFNYKDPQVYYSENISGMERRISRLLGINDLKRKYLSHCAMEHFEIYMEENQILPEGFRWRLKDNDGKILLSASVSYPNKEKALGEILAVSRFGKEKKYYAKKQDLNGDYFFNVVDNTGQVIGRRIQFFKTKAEMDTAVDETWTFVHTLQPDCEGFHLVEHILLRPLPQESTDDAFLGICVNESCNDCSGAMDPYSFRATAIVPYWPERFQHMDFRNFFETTIRMEAPANVHVKVCWVDEEDMAFFESKYFPWLRQMAQFNPSPMELIQARNELINAMNALRSVYPESRLYDCASRKDRLPVLLDHSVLGST